MYKSILAAATCWPAQTHAPNACYKCTLLLPAHVQHCDDLDVSGSKCMLPVPATVLQMPGMLEHLVTDTMLVHCLQILESCSAELQELLAKVRTYAPVTEPLQQAFNVVLGAVQQATSTSQSSLPPEGVVAAASHCVCSEAHLFSMAASFGLLSHVCLRACPPSCTIMRCRLALTLFEAR